MCRVLGVSPSGYYAWDSRPPSARARADEALLIQIRSIHARSRRTYGAPRIHAELREMGVRCGKKRIARLMRQAAVQGAYRRRAGRTTIRDLQAPLAPDWVRRAFAVAHPDRLWVADITYIRTWAGWLYLAVVLDAFSRRVVGWAMQEHLETSLVLDALNMALRQCDGGGVLRHPGDGATHAADVPASRGCPARSLRLHRGLLQSSSAALSLGVSLTNGIREEVGAERSSLRFHPPRNRGNSSEGNSESFIEGCRAYVDENK